MLPMRDVRQRVSTNGSAPECNWMPARAPNYRLAVSVKMVHGPCAVDAKWIGSGLTKIALREATFRVGFASLGKIGLMANPCDVIDFKLANVTRCDGVVINRRLADSVSERWQRSISDH